MSRFDDFETDELRTPLHAVPLPFALRHARPKPSVWPSIAAITALTLLAASCLAVLVR